MNTKCEIDGCSNNAQPKLTTSGTTVMPPAAASSGGRSLAESVTIATWDTVEGSSVGALRPGAGGRPWLP